MFPNIDAERARLGWSRVDLASHLNVSYSTLKNWIDFIIKRHERLWSKALRVFISGFPLSEPSVDGHRAAYSFLAPLGCGQLLSKLGHGLQVAALGAACV